MTILMIVLICREIDHVKKIYQKQKENPPLYRNMPPVSIKEGHCYLYFC